MRQKGMALAAVTFGSNTVFELTLKNTVFCNTVFDLFIKQKHILRVFRELAKASEFSGFQS
jgi:hypothetical protein